MWWACIAPTCAECRDRLPRIPALRDGVELSGLLWSPSGTDLSSSTDASALWGPHRSTVVYAHPSWYAQQGYLVFVLDARPRQLGR